MRRKKQIHKLLSLAISIDIFPTRNTKGEDDQTSNPSHPPPEHEAAAGLERAVHALPPTYERGAIKNISLHE